MPADAGFVRPMARCKVAPCRRWWSIEPFPPNYNAERDGPALCACGGELEIVDMVEHMKTVPVAPKEKP